MAVQYFYGGEQPGKMCSVLAKDDVTIVVYYVYCLALK